MAKIMEIIKQMSLKKEKVKKQQIFETLKNLILSRLLFLF